MSRIEAVLFALWSLLLIGGTWYIKGTFCAARAEKQASLQQKAVIDRQVNSEQVNQQAGSDYEKAISDIDAYYDRLLSSPAGSLPALPATTGKPACPSVSDKPAYRAIERQVDIQTQRLISLQAWVKAQR